MLRSTVWGTVDHVLLPRPRVRAIGVVLLSGGILRAESAQTCIGDYEAAQSLRSAGHFGAAVQKFAACASRDCPAAVAQECTTFRSKVDAATPSIVVDAKDERAVSIEGLRVLVDGVVRAPSEGATGIKVDPGPHVVRGEAPGYSPAETELELAADGGVRTVVLVMAHKNDDERRSAVAPAGAPERVSGDASRDDSSRLVAYVFGGVGVVAMGGFAYFGLAGTSERHDLDKCKPYCDSSRVDSARLKLTLADVSLGIGVASLGAGVYFFVKSLDHGAGQTKVGIAALPGGAAAAMAATF